ncbi:Pnap_2097 family protein [Methylobacterium sp. Leaf118]|uniref:Pnap_2097 family protein n=1 Tax=Methylobacterium sp. Leaf118 TaxID=2876562 RepID=UPI001E2D9456|nr:Pnap_2097 family protein [Methylobacterium sp. Leaf118]
MSLHMRIKGVSQPLKDDSCHVLGMPHLCPSGLSENWLWKELGHRHWGLIAKAFGRAEAGFGPAGEPPVYAAFRRISLQGGDLGGVRENDALDVRSMVTYLSKTRVISRHFATCRDRLVADVEMTSVFVRRQAEGVNRSIARIRIEDRGHAMPAFAALLGQPSIIEHVFSGAVAAPDECELGTLVVEPCPHLDFNGAGLLYFSSFVAAVDRAEWRFLGKRSCNYATRVRRALFHANVEIGDRLSVRILASGDEASCCHRALLSTEDGNLLAEIVTRRAMP